MTSELEIITAPDTEELVDELPIQEVINLSDSTEVIELQDSSGIGEIEILDTSQPVEVLEAAQQGLPGAPGSSLVSQGAAGSSINSFKLVVKNSQGLLEYASSDNLFHANKIVGISTTSGTQGSIIQYQETGEVQNQGWNFNQGDFLFLGLQGELTTAQTGLFSQWVGWVIQPSIIYLRVFPACVRG
jgi:hypothetical protein